MPPWLILMGALAALGPLAIDMYLPAFGAMALDLRVHPGLIERTLASYLLGLAVRHQCRFVSFDARLSLQAVPGARAEHLVTL